ncbi:MAG: HypC/HybG/HupF family hydrogenase formation chaperone [Candidatus Sericytochromatia bacterium]|jgi:hydrogenase expression/formation protein HypC|nr:HypC/HybG/HupF family hydrogenase formation chaperone [Candidatus Sericytochromatia bacterium]
MCLALPGEIIAIIDPDDLLLPAKVSFGGIIKEISLAYVPEAQVGDYVLVHVGFALSLLDPEAAEKVLADLQTLIQIEKELKP